MDVYKALRELYDEKKRLDSAIFALEARERTITPANGATRGRRGRRSMSQDERTEVSQRMSRYWASQRAKGQKSEAMAASGDSSSFPMSIQGAA